MKTKKFRLENINGNVPMLLIDEKLNKLDNQILFPEKVKKAKQIISKIGLPKEKFIKASLN